MDVTFTNVLEGARQYFQGLPTTTSSTTVNTTTITNTTSSASGGTFNNAPSTNPVVYSNSSTTSTSSASTLTANTSAGHKDEVVLNKGTETPNTSSITTTSTIQIQTSSASQYWQTQRQQTLFPGDQDTRYRSNIQQQHSQKQRSDQEEMYRFPKSALSGTPAQYQNHMTTPYHHHHHQYQQQPPQLPTQRVPSGHEIPPPSSTVNSVGGGGGGGTANQHLFHNMTNSHHQNEYQSYQSQQHHQQQHRSFYPPSPAPPVVPFNTTKNESYKTPPPMTTTITTATTSVTSLSQQSQENPYYKHLYSSQVKDVVYNNQSSPSASLSAGSTVPTAAFRSTHSSLPPIAQLSSINPYHYGGGGGGRGNAGLRDVNRSAKTKKYTDGSTINTNTITTATTTITTSVSVNRLSGTSAYTMPPSTSTTNVLDYNQQTNNSGPQQQYPHNSYYNYSSMSNSTNISSASTSTATTHSSYSPILSNSTASKGGSTKFNNFEPQTQPLQLTSMTSLQTSTTNTSPTKLMKRESPLDLSVKTVRTPADSTLDDMDHAKYFANKASISTSNYPTYDVYASSFQRARSTQYNNSTVSNQSGVAPPAATAPKVEFRPNFIASALANNYQNYKGTPPNLGEHNKGSFTPQTQNYRYPHPQQQQIACSSKKSDLPRIDFPPPTSSSSQLHCSTISGSNYYQNISSASTSIGGEVSKKRPADVPPSPGIANKITKVDTWRQSIDQQIEQRLSSYQQQQQQQQHKNQNMKPEAINNYGGYRQQYVPPSIPAQPQQQYSVPSTQPPSIHHNQTFVPSVVAHQYPSGGGSGGNYSNYYQLPPPPLPPPSSHQRLSGSVQNTNHSSFKNMQNASPNSVIGNSGTGGNSTNVGANNNNSIVGVGGGGADKRVLSLLRNSLEIKGAKEAQKKLEQQQQIGSAGLTNNIKNRSDVQHPSTDVTAPVQPKTGGTNQSTTTRHNISPFTPSNIPAPDGGGTSNTIGGSMYKLHMPKAVDSVNFDENHHHHHNHYNNNNNSHHYNQQQHHINQQQHHITGALHSTVLNPASTNADLDGLAAFLAARIRTKAELKQSSGVSGGNVGGTNSTHRMTPPITNSNASIQLQEVIENQLKAPLKQETNNCAGGYPPPKLVAANAIITPPPRRRLFSRSENDDSNGGTGGGGGPHFSSNRNVVPGRDKSGMRSSSETSVFDFPDTDSEGEMPVLERQTLEDMRRDRKSIIGTTNNSGGGGGAQMIPNKIEGVLPQTTVNQSLPSPDDTDFTQLCDSFVEQLKNGSGKKRGRRKKVVPVVSTSSTITTTNISNSTPTPSSSTAIKTDSVTVKSEDLKPSVISPVVLPKVEPTSNDDGDDSDVPLIKIKKEDKSENNNTQNISTNNDKVSGSPKKEPISVPSGLIQPRPARKPFFGDGSDFGPGWEEEVCKYKKSLRMPPSLIQVTRPPQYHRLSTSLPDLDPCPHSPMPLSLDLAHKLLNNSKVSSHVAPNKQHVLNNKNNSDDSVVRKLNKSFPTTENNSAVKLEINDPDENESQNSTSFNLSSNNNNNISRVNYDSEDGGGSSTNKGLSIVKDSSILDRLLEKYGGGRKRQKNKVNNKKEDRLKIVPKSEKCQELLPTPIIIDTNEKIEKGKANNAELGFRKKTIDNFKEVFLNNVKNESVATYQHRRNNHNHHHRHLQKKKRTTIKEVFGEDRPASAPPVTCVDRVQIKQEADEYSENVEEENKNNDDEDDDDDDDDDSVLSSFIKKETRDVPSPSPLPPTTTSLPATFTHPTLLPPPPPPPQLAPKAIKQALKNKLINRGRNEVNSLLMKVLADKKKKATATTTSTTTTKATTKKNDRKKDNTVYLGDADGEEEDDDDDEVVEVTTNERREEEDEEDEDDDEEEEEEDGEDDKKSVNNAVSVSGVNSVRENEDTKLSPSLEDTKTNVKQLTKTITESCSNSGVSGNNNNNNSVGGVTKRRSKFRNIRRKFSSGFDYIRKKKKTQPAKQRDTLNSESMAKVQSGGNNNNSEQKNEEQQQTLTAKSTRFKSSRTGTATDGYGTIQDIQKEIKGWVLNKGIGETHLHRSARLGYTDITAFCLEKLECPPSPKDNAGYTPLHEASARGHLGIAKMLLMYGANVSESARGGIRPLHEAVENGYVEIVRLLLSYGADPLLATYSGMTPLLLATDDITIKLLQEHINDLNYYGARNNGGGGGGGGSTLNANIAGGISNKTNTEPSPWLFLGPSNCLDFQEIGYDALATAPEVSPEVPNLLQTHFDKDNEDDGYEEEDFELSDVCLPNLYTLRSEPQTDRWVLLQDLTSMLKVKSRDALLRQICTTTTTTTATPAANYKSVLRELKMSDFLEQAQCCQFLNIGEKVNIRASKIALVKYTDKVKAMLNVEKVTISVR